MSFPEQIGEIFFFFFPENFWNFSLPYEFFLQSIEETEYTLEAFSNQDFQFAQWKSSGCKAVLISFKMSITHIGINELSEQLVIFSHLYVHKHKFATHNWKNLKV